MKNFERVKRPSKMKKTNKYGAEIEAILLTDGTEEAVILVIPEGQSSHSMRAALHSALRTRFYNLHVKNRDENSMFAWCTKRQEKAG